VKDWCDWRGDRAEFLAILAAAKEATASIEPLNLAEFLDGDPPEVHWRWHGWIARGDLALAVGDPGVGKSLFVLGLACASRCGRRFLDAPTERVRVGVFDYENPLDEAHKRLRTLGLTAADHDGLVYFHAPQLNLNQADGAATLGKLIEEHDLDVVIVDSLRRAAPGLDENDSAAVSSVMTPLRSLTASSGRTIIVVHHSRKRIGDQPTDAGQMVRGSLDFVASVDCLLYLRQKEPDAFALEHAKARRGRPHESILVRIVGDDDERQTVELVNEGPIAQAEDKVEALLAKIIQALQAEGAPLARQVLALRVDADSRSGTYGRALNLGWQRNLLAKSESDRRGQPVFYSLAEGVRA
jgi:hypothetical protein